MEYRIWRTVPAGHCSDGCFRRCAGPCAFASGQVDPRPFPEHQHVPDVHAPIRFPGNVLVEDLSYRPLVEPVGLNEHVATDRAVTSLAELAPYPFSNRDAETHLRPVQESRGK